MGDAACVQYMIVIPAIMSALWQYLWIVNRLGLLLNAFANLLDKALMICRSSHITWPSQLEESSDDCASVYGRRDEKALYVKAHLGLKMRSTQRRVPAIVDRAENGSLLCSIQVESGAPSGLTRPSYHAVAQDFHARSETANAGTRMVFTVQSGNGRRK